MKCPNCQGKVEFEDHTIVGGPKEYWSCTKCGEEMEMYCLGPALKNKSKGEK